MDSDVLCLDLDFTVIRYIEPAFTELTYAVLGQAMVRRGYSEMLLEPLWTRRALEFTQNGLVADLSRGNILSVGKDCEVLRCFYGFTAKTEEEVKETYGDPPCFPLSPSHRVLGQYWCFLTHFAIMEAALYSACVELISRHITLKSLSDLEADLLASVLEIFDTPQGEAQDRSFYDTIYKHPGKYIRTESRILDLLKSVGKTLVLVTNSYEEYTNFVCEYALGKGWKEAFDWAVVGADKPVYFGDGIEGKMLSSGWKQGGSYRDLEERYQGKSFTFIGDHFLNDISAPKKLLHWPVIAILSELETEVLPTTQPYYPHFGLFLQEENYWIQFVLRHATSVQPSLESLLLKAN